MMGSWWLRHRGCCGIALCGLLGCSSVDQRTASLPHAAEPSRLLVPAAVAAFSDETQPPPDRVSAFLPPKGSRPPEAAAPAGRRSAATHFSLSEPRLQSADEITLTKGTAETEALRSPEERRAEASRWSGPGRPSGSLETTPQRSALETVEARPNLVRDGDVLRETVEEGQRVKYIVARVDAGDAAAPAPPSPFPSPAPGIGEQEAEAAADDAWAEPLNEYPLDLPTALALVSGRNAQVGFARWRIEEAYADLERAETLWLPSIQAGANYHRHDGTLQNSNGAIQDVNRSSLQAGFGAGAVGAGTTMNPGLVARFHLADAIFQPRIAERTAWARGHAVHAVLHDRLLDAALAYLDLLEAAQQEAIARETLGRTRQLADLTEQFAEIGQGLQADADRVATEFALRRNDLVRAQEAMDVASSRLAEVISLNAMYRIHPAEMQIVPIHVVPPQSTRRDLIAAGLSNRPELKESQCLVAEACERLKREEYAPFVPSVLLGLSYGGFGGGMGGAVSRFHDRADFDALAIWEVRNLGFGEQAARDSAGSRIEQEKWRQVQIMDRVGREVSEAHIQVQSRFRQISVAEEAILAAQDSYDHNMTRIQQGQGLPLEALQSIQALDAARREYLRAVVDYNESQFRLHRSLGWPIHSMAGQ